MNRSGYFITGTDTGIGKTMVTTALAAALQARNLGVMVQKPVQTGGHREGTRWRAPDLAFLLETLDLHPDAETLAAMLPYCFAPACSPHLAARLANERIALDAIRYAFHQLAAQYDRVLVEGAGGILVPINERETMRDLMRVLGLPVILVIRPSLGTLNHTLLSLEALRAVEIDIAGFVSVDGRPEAWGLIEKDNMKTLETMGDATYLGHVPFLEQVEPGPELKGMLLPIGSKILDRLENAGACRSE